MPPPLRGKLNSLSEPVRGRAVKVAPADRVPREGETIYGKVTVNSVSDYVIDQETGCWVWQKFLNRGYPSDRAHRLYYARAYGPVPERHDVHHRCENKACVNPAHLEAVDNCAHRGGHIRERKRFLTWEQAREIRARVQADHAIVYHEIAAEYGCSRALVQDIVECVAFPEPGAEWKKPERDCLKCGTPIGPEKRRDARFCTPACRQSYNDAKPAARARRTKAQREYRKARA